MYFIEKITCSLYYILLDESKLCEAKIFEPKFKKMMNRLMTKRSYKLARNITLPKRPIYLNSFTTDKTRYDIDFCKIAVNERKFEKVPAINFEFIIQYVLMCIGGDYAGLVTF